VNGTVAALITLGAVAMIVGALWLIWWTSRGSGAVAPQSTTHVWDDDLTEYNNPLPRWWLWLFLITIVFGIVYFALYPGLGNFKGALGWTEVGAWRAEHGAAEHAFDARFASLQDKSLNDLSQDPAAMAAARNLFALNCSGCHGSDARGAKGFPNLTDGDWLWGGSEDTIYQTISLGRDGVMPAWGTVLGDKGVEQVEAYVLSLSGRDLGTPAASAQLAASGKTTFETLCSACHGLDGKGNPLLGAPNLTDRVWLHGGSVADIRETIANGRTNHMPAQLERLGATKVRLLGAYVLAVSHDANPAQ
jgi:cytochrome c oxidase cbb3-type subunit 3